jgi:hypothetical protein
MELPTLLKYCRAAQQHRLLSATLRLGRTAGASLAPMRPSTLPRRLPTLQLSSRLEFREEEVEEGVVVENQRKSFRTTQELFQEVPPTQAALMMLQTKKMIN